MSLVSGVAVTAATVTPSAVAMTAETQNAVVTIVAVTVVLSLVCGVKSAVFAYCCCVGLR